VFGLLGENIASSKPQEEVGIGPAGGWSVLLASTRVLQQGAGQAVGEENGDLDPITLANIAAPRKAGLSSALEIGRIKLRVWHREMSD
jgi:hypothetical protein